MVVTVTLENQDQLEHREHQEDQAALGLLETREWMEYQDLMGLLEMQDQSDLLAQQVAQAPPGKSEILELQDLQEHLGCLERMGHPVLMASMDSLDQQDLQDLLVHLVTLDNQVLLDLLVTLEHRDPWGPQARGAHLEHLEHLAKWVPLDLQEHLVPVEVRGQLVVLVTVAIMVPKEQGEKRERRETEATRDQQVLRVQRDPVDCQVSKGCQDLLGHKVTKDHVVLME